MRLTIIIPTLDEAAGIVATLATLQPLRADGHEVIVADGGSADDTARLAQPLADRVVTALRGRGRQMNTGAALAGGEVLLFLHADTRLPPDAAQLIADGLRRTGREWGRFDIVIASRRPLLRVVAACMNIRSRLSGIATGDQAIFVRRTAFTAVGGFAPVSLMEDVDLSRRLKRLSPPLCVARPALTSDRRWASYGVIRTILLMWWLRLRYFLGASPDRLASIYERRPRQVAR